MNKIAIVKKINSILNKRVTTVFKVNIFQRKFVWEEECQIYPTEKRTVLNNLLDRYSDRFVLISHIYFYSLHEIKYSTKNDFSA